MAKRLRKIKQGRVQTPYHTVSSRVTKGRRVGAVKAPLDKVYASTAKAPIN